MTAPDVVYPAASATGSRLVLHMRNRHITYVDNDGLSIVLRPPGLGNWRKILSKWITAEGLATVKATEADPRGPLQRTYGGNMDDPDADTEAPYAEAFALAVQLCSGTAVPVDNLPVWAGQGSLFAVFYEHWRRIDVSTDDPIEEPAETPPVGYGSASSQASELPAAPPSPTTESPVYAPPDGEHDPSIPTFDLAAVAAAEAGGIPGGAPPGGTVVVPV